MKVNINRLEVIYILGLSTQTIPNGVAVIFLNQTDASFCGHREDVTQPWKNDKCKLTIVNGAASCNCTALGEVTLFSDPDTGENKSQRVKKTTGIN